MDFFIKGRGEGIKKERRKEGVGADIEELVDALSLFFAKQASSLRLHLVIPSRILSNTFLTYSQLFLSIDFTSSASPARELLALPHKSGLFPLLLLSMVSPFANHQLPKHQKP